jgi:hypothetical protein
VDIKGKKGPEKKINQPPHSLSHKEEKSDDSKSKNEIDGASKNEAL